jgi:Flp pilus assembly pilin Flp
MLRGARPDDSQGTDPNGGAATPRQKGVQVRRLVARWQVFASDALHRVQREEGQTMAEYGVVLAVVTLIVLVALTTLSTSVRGALTAVANVFPGN